MLKVTMTCASVSPSLIHSLSCPNNNDNNNNYYYFYYYYYYYYYFRHCPG